MHCSEKEKVDIAYKIIHCIGISIKMKIKYSKQCMEKEERKKTQVRLRCHHGWRMQTAWTKIQNGCQLSIKLDLEMLHASSDPTRMKPTSSLLSNSTFLSMKIRQRNT